MRRLAAGFVLASGMLLPVAPAAQPAPQSTPALQLFLRQADEPLTSYRGRRFLEAGNSRFRKQAWIEVATEFGPAGFSYRILSEGGADVVRRKVLYPALESERALDRNERPRAFTEENYRFELDGTEGDLARIRVMPRRKEPLLVDGWILVSPRDGDLLTVKGRLAKSPSFWTTRVDIVRRYARIAGIRVPVSVESTASVRLAGNSTFSMRYEYDQINGLPVAAASR
jgi:hypothetical protein